MNSLLLFMRTLLGWGEHPDALRARHDKIIRDLPWLIGFWLAGCAFFPGMLYMSALSAHHIPSLARELRASAPIIIWLTLMCSVIPLLATTFGILARRGARSGMTSTHGRCFAVLTGRAGYLFARIGLTPEAARWYALPLDWDEVVEPGDAEYELTVNPGSGWVARVRRLGSAPRELVQEVPVMLTGKEARPADREALRSVKDEGATKEERLALKRYARSRKLWWRASTGRIA